VGDWADSNLATPDTSVLAAATESMVISDSEVFKYIDRASKAVFSTSTMVRLLAKESPMVHRTSDQRSGVKVEVMVWVVAEVLEMVLELVAEVVWTVVEEVQDEL